MIRKILMSLTVFVGLVAIGELASRAIWSVADLSLSAENAHLIDHPTRLWVQAPNARFNLPEHGELRTNALGLRDGAVTIPKPRGNTGFSPLASPRPGDTASANRTPTRRCWSAC